MTKGKARVFAGALLAATLIGWPMSAGVDLSAATSGAVGAPANASGEYQAVAWGQNTFGQLGDDSFEQRDAPVQVRGAGPVTALAGGLHHSLALLADGTVMAWGQNSFGQLGDGEGGTSDVPVPVEGIAGATAIAAGDNHSLALLSDGTVMAWGEDEQGQLGDGKANEGSDVPVAVKGLSEVIAIAAGGDHSLALLADGTVMAWGEDEHGELGNGKTGKSNVPVAVKGLSEAIAIAAGGDHSLALLSDGTVMAWGSDEYGQLGDLAVEGDEEERRSKVPVAVEGVSGATGIAAGAHHSLALLSDGTVMAWGQDTYGELGNGSVARSEETPAPVSGLAEATAIAAGGEHSLALLAGGTAMAWGEDAYGELGDGVAGEPGALPVAVNGLGELRGVAAGAFHDLAYSEPFPVVTGLSPRSGALSGGAEVTITGSNLEEATAVAFGAQPASSFTVQSPTSIAAVAPAGAAGAVNVTVTTPAGASAVGAADRFRYVPAPTVKKLSPKVGPGAGGTTVTIKGANLEGATAVAFGGYPAAAFTVQSATSITAVSPPGAGVQDVTVTTPGGTNAASRHGQFRFTPAVEGLAPSAGPAAGGTSVTINGAGFAPGVGATVFKFGSQLATDVECASTTTCTAITPANKARTERVTAVVGKLKSAKNPPAAEFTFE